MMTFIKTFMKNFELNLDEVNEKSIFLTVLFGDSNAKNLV